MNFKSKKNQLWYEQNDGPTSGAKHEETVDESIHKNWRFAEQLQGRHFVLDKREDNPAEQSTGDSHE